jgi:hypothetical protein
MGVAEKLDWKGLIASTCFEHLLAHHQEVLYIQQLIYFMQLSETHWFLNLRKKHSLPRTQLTTRQRLYFISSSK